MTLGAEVPKPSAPKFAFHILREGFWQTAHSTFSLAGQLALRSLAWFPLASSAIPGATQLQLPQEYVSLQVSLLSGNEAHLRIVSPAFQSLLESMATCCAVTVHLHT